MFNFFILLLLLICTSCTQKETPHAAIETIDNFQSLHSFVIPGEKTLIVFDIDNTLATPAQSIGSDEWLSYQIKTKMAEGLSNIAALYLTLPLCYVVQFSTPMVLTDQYIPTLCDWFTSNNIFSIALTARSLYLADRTIEQLQNIGISFNLPANAPIDFYLPLTIPAIYKQGIIFSADNDKGTALTYFLNHLNFYPDHIIFIDDKEHHVVHVCNAMKKIGITCTGLRYSGCDKKVAAFDPEDAEQEMDAFIATRLVRHSLKSKGAKATTA